MEAPQLPFVPRLINRVGKGLSRLGVQPIDLGLEGLLARAQRSTGLDDFGDDGFRQGLSRLLDSLERDAGLHPLGRFIVRSDLQQSLERRLRLQDWHTRHPEIGRGEIRRPIVICGQGRTGTTILHELLALDAANRVPLTWEVDHPFPPPESTTYASDPRIELAQRMLDRSEALIPDFKRIHRMGAALPQECVRITACEFSSAIFTAQWRVTSYTEWLLDEAPMKAAYETHRRMLQLLQWRCPGERWVVKSPGHLWCMDDVIDAYPDALVVQTHRDPLRILSSLTSLEVVLRSMASDEIDPLAIAREWSRWTASAYERSVDFRERGRLPAAQIFDLRFRELIADPIASLRRLYGHFDLELTPELERRMQEYVARNPSDRDGRHVHRFADTGLDQGEERAKVKRYQDFFDVPNE